MRERELNTETLAMARKVLDSAGYDIVRTCSTDVKKFDPAEFHEYLDNHTDMNV